MAVNLEKEKIPSLEDGKKQPKKTFRRRKSDSHLDDDHDSEEDASSEHSQSRASRASSSDGSLKGSRDAIKQTKMASARAHQKTPTTPLTPITPVPNTEQETIIRGLSGKISANDRRASISRGSSKDRDSNDSRRDTPERSAAVEEPKSQDEKGKLKSIIKNLQNQISDLTVRTLQSARQFVQKTARLEKENIELKTSEAKLRNEVEDFKNTTKFYQEKIATLEDTNRAFGERLDELESHFKGAKTAYEKSLHEKAQEIRDLKRTPITSFRRVMLEGYDSVEDSADSLRRVPSRDQDQHFNAFSPPTTASHLSDSSKKQPSVLRGSESSSSTGARTHQSLTVQPLYLGKEDSDPGSDSTSSFCCFTFKRSKRRGK